MRIAESLRAENIQLTKTGYKRCSRCQEKKLIDDNFSRRKRAKPPHNVGEVLHVCKMCATLNRKEKQGPETHWYRLYGLTPENARAMKTGQDFKCAVCREEPRPSRGGYYEWYVDHDHATGNVRALVCQSCNTMLGFAKDSPEILEAGAEYLRNHGA